MWAILSLAEAQHIAEISETRRGQPAVGRYCSTVLQTVKPTDPLPVVTQRSKL